MNNFSIKYALKYRLVGWLGLLFFVSLYFIPWAETLNVALAIITVFVLLSIVTLIDGYSTVKITSDMIIKRKLFKAYGLKWDEIESIQYWESGDLIGCQSMVLEGQNKRLFIAGPGDWAGGEAGQARQWFYAELRRRGLGIRASSSVLFKFTRNARMP